MNRQVDVIRYRGERVKVYADDYGQCYYFVYKGHSYSCGMYNYDYLREIVDTVDYDLDETFHIDPDKPNRPSMRVYKRHGVWYCDYLGVEGFLVSYGDLLKSGDRPTKSDLISKGKEIMALIDSPKEQK